MRVFTWVGDYKTTELWEKGGFRPIPLSIIDVLMGLQTGLIDAIGTNPLVALSMQWFGVANHMLDMKWGLLTGAIVIDKRVWGRINPENQEKMLEIANEIGLRNQEKYRFKDQDAIEIMKQHGLIVHKQTPEEYVHWKEYIKSRYPNIQSTFAPKVILDKVIRLKEEKDRLDQHQK